MVGEGRTVSRNSLHEETSSNELRGEGLREDIGCKNKDFRVRLS